MSLTQSGNTFAVQGTGFSSDPHCVPRKKRRAKREMQQPEGLSMNSLMDIMTILLVFLLKSYSTDPVQLKQADDLKVPFASSQLKPVESTTLTLTRNNVLVDDEPVLALASGQVPQSHIGDSGLMVDTLLAALQQRVTHQRKVAQFNEKAEFQGILTIIADRHIPFKLLAQALYTAGQAEFSKFKFAVVKTEAGS